MVQKPTYKPGVLLGPGRCIVTEGEDGRHRLTFYLEDRHGRAWHAVVNPVEVYLSPGQPLREGETQYDART